MRKLTIVVVPSSLFKFRTQKQIFISRSQSVSNFSDKILRILNAHLYNIDRKSKPFAKGKLWKYCNSNIEEIMALEKKLTSFTTSEIDAKLVSLEDIVDNMEIANDDVLLYELPYKNNFVFAPIKRLTDFELEANGPPSGSPSTSVEELRSTGIQSLLP